jgi:ABC-type Fe3+/spermidine/putrescine transport system ATPase subunit
MIAGFELPDDGEVLFDDRSVGKVPVNKRNIGMVFQSYALFPHMTVFQNVAYGLEQQKVSRADIKPRVMEALATVHMEDFADRKPKQLSGGQQQRVALARALVIRPKVLLLDECLSALDKKLRVEMQGELRKILEESHVTTFFVTHDQEEAMTLSDRIVVMRDGIIEQTGTPHEVYERPVNRFVADFLGKANFFEGKIVSAGNGMIQLETAGGSLTIPGNADSASVGQQAVFAVRPEKLSVRKVSRPEEGTICGTLDAVVYSGNLTSCTLDCGNGLTVKAEMNGTSMPELPVRGDILAVTWNPADTIRLED